MKYYNNNPAFGDGGPHEADSVEALADEMQPNFEEWANDQENQAAYPEELAPREERIAEMRADFISGLTEVYTLAMTDGTTDQTEEVPADMVQADTADTAAELWSLARDYEGTCKYRLYDSAGELIDEGTW